MTMPASLPDQYPEPEFEDVGEQIADILPVFTRDALVASCCLTSVALILGSRREVEMFPTVHRFAAGALIAWEDRTTVMMAAEDAITTTFDPAYAPLRPYLVLPTAGFDGLIRAAIAEIDQRLRLKPGMELLWMGSGGHVTPLHHDGDEVDGRWHLVVRGAKQFDFIPPNAPGIPKMPWWSLHHRFSRLYDAQLPTAWQESEVGAERLYLAPGHMVRWPRRWWHRVEIAPSGNTIALSTRGRLTTTGRLRFNRHRLRNRVIGDVEDYLERTLPQRPLVTLADLTALQKRGEHPQ